jgi:hypothetical protein
LGRDHNLVISVMPTILFDTSGLNELAKDCESQALMAGLSSGYHVLLSETNINEIGATSNAEKRTLLLQLCQRLLHTGSAIQSCQWILNAMANRHSADPESFDWRKVDVRFRALEEEIGRREFLGNDSVADELRTDDKATNDEFKALFKEARATLMPVIKDGPSVTDVLELLTVDESPLWRLAQDIYRAGAGKAAAEIRGFVAHCPPVNAVLLSMCVGLYHWGARSDGEQSAYGAGALDLFMAAYLPSCDTFVTNDPGQHAALRLVAERAGLSTGILTYSEWREKLLLA